MASFIDTLIDRAKADKKTIVLPEGNDERILEAAQEALAQGIANIIILGDADEIPSSFRYSARHRSRIPKNLAQRRRAKNATNQPIRLVRGYVFTPEFAAR